MRKFVAILLSIMLLISLAIPAFASGQSGNQRIVHLSVKNGVLEQISRTEYNKAVSATSLVGNEANVITLTLETTKNATSTAATVLLEGAENLTANKDKLAVAEYLLQQLDYSEERLAFMSEESKLAYVSKKPITVTMTRGVINEDGSIAYVTNSYPVEDTNSRGVVESTLMYEQGDASNQWEITLDSFYGGLSVNLNNIHYYPSIAVQNCRILPSESGYLRYSINGAEPYTAEEYDTNDFETFAGEGTLSGHGRYVDVTIPASNYVTQRSDFQVFIEVTAQNSSVEPNGAFGIYGNFPTATIVLGNPSVSFPWGISLDVNITALDLKTELTAFYKPGSGGGVVLL